ncbi:polysaccharide biosynthesis/export family protein [Croceibacterium sp. TMG7-5b_MA50]|uniref:polysaccharide biosynthesis/export family protein n=1 Tax=Croceibacterium sp. TMG7-5b_MA50 TaxID=3121290 RepID=UPI003221D4D1
MAGLAGCSTLPNSGPTGRQVIRSATQPEVGSPIRVVPVAVAADLPQSLPPPAMSLPQLPPPPTDMVGPGDVLDITIYEAGVTLFTDRGAAGPTASAPGVRGQQLPPRRVDDNGDIVIPYAGRQRVLGRTLAEVQTQIREALSRISQNPQVLVTLSQPITNTVIVGGEVMRPGRLVLQTNRERLSDVIALAGGTRREARDMTLRVTRGGQVYDMRLADLVEYPQLDVATYPGDRILLIDNPRSFSVLGASGQVQQLPFPRSDVSLAQAIATAGGANPNLGDPAAIFVFRYVPDATGTPVPVVYHFNMMNVGTYFLAQRFIMQDKDMLYFGNARANQPAKAFQLISQLFTPLITVAAGVNAVNGN